MAAPRVDIISIGTLSRNLLWNEPQSVRTAHATTTLIRSGDHTILVDPGLPPVILKARLSERAGLVPEQIDTVFLTNFRPSHRAGLALFNNARKLIHEMEKRSVSQSLTHWIEQAPSEDLDRQTLQEELELLESLDSPDQDSLAPGVDLFPLFGYTPGTCGLLVAAPTLTILIAGDAIATQDHFLAGQVLPDSADIPSAQEALREAYEIADLIVPGHDNLFVNPRTMGM